MRPQLHIHEHGTQYTTIREDRHEHRAPTDDSVRLLREMEAKAEERILSVHLENNTIHATWHVLQDYQFASRRIVCQYKVNGTDKKFEFKLNDFGRQTPEQIAFRLRDELAKHIASWMVNQVFMNDEAMRYELTR